MGSSEWIDSDAPLMGAWGVDYKRESIEKGFELLGPTLFIRGVLHAAFFERFIQILQQFPLVLSEFDWGLDGDVTIQVALKARANALDAFASKSELFTRLRALGDVYGSLALQGRDLNLSTQSGRGKTNGHSTMQIVPISLKDVVFVDSDLDVQISSRPSIGARLTIACRANAHA